MKSQRAEMAENVPIPESRVAAPRAHREIRHGVQPPPLLGELRKRLLAGAEEVDLPRPFPPHDLRLKRLGVALAADDLGVRAAGGIAPADTPHGAALALDPFDAHRRAPPFMLASSSIGRKLPRGGGAV
jgi:hypothetical protein